MVEVIPSINVRSFEELKARIRLVEPHVHWCHLDVTDGIFSTHETWKNPADLANLETSLNVEVHLMVSDPDVVIDDWLVPPVKRLIIHAEVVKDFPLLLEKIRDRDIEVGMSVNPETSWEALSPYFGKADMLQVLCVHPGPSGQDVDWPIMLGKVRDIRKACQECIIEVDGGVNPETGKRAVEAGVSLLVSGEYVFSHSSIQESISNLKNL